jgi:hypothetical protein
MIGDLCDIVKNEGIIQDVIVEEIIQDIIVEPIQDIILEETTQDVILEETTQDVILEETIQDIIVEENDTSNDMRAVQCAFVSNIIDEENEEDEEDEEEEEKEGGEGGGENVTKKNVGKTFSCDQCQYSTDIKSSFKKHLKSIKHVLYFQVREIDENCKHQCKVCNKKYLSQPGLWAHNQTCKPPVVPPVVAPVVAAVQAPPVVDLHAKIDNLERIMMEMAKNLVS